MKSNPKNFSVKIIKGHAYIYSWSYRKASYRSSTSLSRYYWKYRGKYGTRRVNDFMKRLDTRKQTQLKKEVQTKLELHKELQEQVQDLLKKEPFKTRHSTISAIKNRLTREKELQKLYSEINSLIKNKDQT